MTEQYKNFEIVVTATSTNTFSLQIRGGRFIDSEYGFESEERALVRGRELVDEYLQNKEYEEMSDEEYYREFGEYP